MSTVTIPPSRACLVITLLPSAAISAIGNPGRAIPGTVRNPEKLPPVACAPHSMMCPAVTAPARASQSSGVQPCHHAAGPTVSEASVTRPVITMSAPRAQRRGDAEAAQVGVGRDRLARPSP